MIQWVHKLSIYDESGLAKLQEVLPNIKDDMVPAVPLDALKEMLREIVGQAHGGAMLGGDAAYQACLKVEAMTQRLLAPLEGQA